MTKSEERELEHIRAYLRMEMYDTAARSLSALIRACRSSKTKQILHELARDWELANNPEFITGD